MVAGADNLRCKDCVRMSNGLHAWVSPGTNLPPLG